MIRESGENYLEAILVLSQSMQHVHASDIAKHLNYSKPSITKAMKKLKQNQLITVDQQNHITLTELGQQKAEEIFKRHKIITQFLVLNGVQADIADSDACRMEHVINSQTFEAIKRIVQQKSS